jgi:hypothetical protein
VTNEQKREQESGDDTVRALFYDEQNPMRYCIDNLRMTLTAIRAGDAYSEKHWIEVARIADTARGIIQERAR